MKFLVKEHEEKVRQLKELHEIEREADNIMISLERTNVRLNYSGISLD